MNEPASVLTPARIAAERRAALETEKTAALASCKGDWRMSQNEIARRALNNRWLERQ